jgi:hypothetical protein
MSSGHITPGWERVGPDVDAARPTGTARADACRARPDSVASQTRATSSTLAVMPAGTPFGSVVTHGLDDLGRPTFFVSRRRGRRGRLARLSEERRGRTVHWVEVWPS